MPARAPGSPQKTGGAHPAACRPGPGRCWGWGPGSCPPPWLQPGLVAAPAAATPRVRSRAGARPPRVTSGYRAFVSPQQWCSGRGGGSPEPLDPANSAFPPCPVGLSSVGPVSGRVRQPAAGLGSGRRPGQRNWEGTRLARVRPPWAQPARPAQQGAGEGREEPLLPGGFSGLCQTPPCLPPPRGWVPSRNSCRAPASLPAVWPWGGPPLPSIGRWRRPWGDGEGTGPDPQQLVPDPGCQSSSWRQGGGTVRAKCRQAGVLSLEGPTGGGGGDRPPPTGSGAQGHPLSRGLCRLLWGVPRRLA